MRNLEVEAVFKHCAELIDKKNSDYATEKDFYSNFRRVENLSIPTWVGIVIRSMDKVVRLENTVAKFNQTGKIHLKNESFEDTFYDLINYFGLALVCYKDWLKTVPIEVTAENKTEDVTDNNDLDKDSIYQKIRKN